MDFGSGVLSFFVHGCIKADFKVFINIFKFSGVFVCLFLVGFFLFVLLVFLMLLNY